VCDNRTEHRAALVPVAKEWITTARRFCIIGEIQSCVARMLRAQKFNGSPHGPRRIADPQNVEGSTKVCWMEFSFFT